MNHLEPPRLIPREQYDQRREQRLNLASPIVGELVVLMSRLNSADKAAKLPARLSDRNQAVVPPQVELSFVDQDLNETGVVSRLDFTESNLIVVLNKLIVTSNGSEYPMEEAYLYDYFDDQFEPILVENQELVAS